MGVLIYLISFIRDAWIAHPNDGIFEAARMATGTKPMRQR